MANEIGPILHATGGTLYVVLFNAAGQVRNVDSGQWADFADADFADYAHALSEIGTASGIYYADLPSGLDGDTGYTAVLYQQAGASPALDDPALEMLAIGPGTLEADAITSDTLAASALTAIADAIGDTGGSGGGGANAVTVTVADAGTDAAIADATVRWSVGPTPALGRTGTDGEYTAGLDNGTYTLTVTRPGYVGYSESGISITAATSKSVELAALTITPSDRPDQCTAYATVYDETGQPEEGVTITIRLYDHTGVNAAGAVFDIAPRTATSDGGGYVEFTGLWRGATYELRRGTGSERTLWTVPAAATAEMPLFKGMP